MKKLIIKTVLITLLSVFAVLLVLVTGMTILAPKTMSNVFYSMGNKHTALWYAELQYQKFGNYGDLENVVVLSNECSDYKRTAKYSKKLIENSNFTTLCAEKDASGNYGMSYFNYIHGNLAVALYKTGVASTEIFVVASETVKTSYTPFNAYTFLIYDDLGQTQEFWLELKNKLTEMDLTLDSVDLTHDIETVTQKINSQN